QSECALWSGMFHASPTSPLVSLMILMTARCCLIVYCRVCCGVCSERILAKWIMLAIRGWMDGSKLDRFKLKACGAGHENPPFLFPFPLSIFRIPSMTDCDFLITGWQRIQLLQRGGEAERLDPGEEPGGDRLPRW